MRAAELLQLAREQAAELTGFEVESVSGFGPDGDEGWTVTVEVLELERVPSTMDLLGSYEIRLGADGEVRGFDRRRRYHRAAAQEDGRS